jgi:hypothetical protein
MAKKKAPEAQQSQEDPAEQRPITEKDMLDRYDGPLKNRSFGLRIDDDVEVQIIAGNSLISITGRIISFKDDLELVDSAGSYHKITMDWIVDVKLIGHNRPIPELDPEMVRKTIKPKLKKSAIDHAYN